MYELGQIVTSILFIILGVLALKKANKIHHMDHRTVGKTFVMILLYAVGVFIVLGMIGQVVNLLNPATT